MVTGGAAAAGAAASAHAPRSTATAAIRPGVEPPGDERSATDVRLAAPVEPAPVRAARALHDADTEVPVCARSMGRAAPHPVGVQSDLPGLPVVAAAGLVDRGQSATPRRAASPASPVDA